MIAGVPMFSQANLNDFPGKFIGWPLNSQTNLNDFPGKFIGRIAELFGFLAKSEQGVKMFL